MSRKSIIVPPIFPAELAQKIKKALRPEMLNMYYKYCEYSNVPNDDHVHFQKWSTLHFEDWGYLSSIKDSLNTSFDVYNIIYEEPDDPASKDFLGYQHIPNTKFSFIGFKAHGELEYPVAFIVYWDGTEIKAYVPYAGNPYNDNTNCAYTHEDDYESEWQNARIRFPNHFPNEKDYLDAIKILNGAKKQLGEHQCDAIDFIKNHVEYFVNHKHFHEIEFSHRLDTLKTNYNLILKELSHVFVSM